MQHLTIQLALEDCVDVRRIAVLFPVEQLINLFKCLALCLNPTNLFYSLVRTLTGRIHFDVRRGGVHIPEHDKGQFQNVPRGIDPISLV